MSFSVGYRGKRRLRRGGLTLIEVVAGLALLGWLLSAVILAKSRNTRQFSRASLKLEAVEAADALMTRWWAHKSQQPPSMTGQGDVPGSDRLTWRASQAANETIESLGGLVVRLEIVDARTGTESPPLYTLDFVVSKEEPETQDSDNPDQENLDDETGQQKTGGRGAAGR
jgi:hypothetical protein